MENPNQNLELLAPNYMGDNLANTGVEGLIANRGYGVSEVTNIAKANPDVETVKESTFTDNLRTQKAREFGLTKQTVGF